MVVSEAAQGEGRGYLLMMMQVSLAHAVSHFHIMTLPALIPLLPARYGVGFVEIGFALTVFSLVSLVALIPFGYLADRVGPQPVLIAGLVLGSAGFASLSWFDSYGWLLVAMACAGLANGSYHPGGYAMISRGVDQKHIGRSFSVYTFAGFLGNAITPAAILGLVTAGGIELAFLVSGIVGLVTACFLLVPQKLRSVSRPAKPATETPAAPDLRLFSPAMGVLTLMFVLLSLSSVGFYNFSVTALMKGYGLDLTLANISLTAFLLTSAGGVLAGGILADRTARHGLVAGFTLLACAVVTGTIGWLMLPAWAIVILMAAAGFTYGVIAPSRDMLVRTSAPKGSEGRAFAIVSMGFNIGGIGGPLIFGWLVDNGAPSLVFVVVTAVILVTVGLIMVQELRMPG